MKNFALLFLLFLSPSISQADIVQTGLVSHRFTILNLDEFPQYRFHVLHQNYRYDRGYRPAGTAEVEVEQGEYMATGAKSYRSLLFATPRDSSSSDSVRVSTIRLGGKDEVDDPRVDYIQDTYRIISINDSIIDLQLMKQVYIERNGKETEIKKGALNTGIELFGIDMIYFALPVACLFGIVFFFLYRRRQSRSHVA